MRAVRGLEVILELPRHSLLTLLRPTADRSAGTWLPVEELCPEPGVRDLLDEIGDRGGRRLTGLSLHDQHVIGRRRELREVRSRAVFQAQQRGVDRWIAVYHHPHGVLPSSRTARGCRFGRVRMDEASGLIAAELLFDRALGCGETYLLEYGFGFDETGPPITEEGRGFRTPRSTSSSSRSGSTPPRCPPLPDVAARRPHRPQGHRRPAAVQLPQRPLHRVRHGRRLRRHPLGVGIHRRD